MRIEDMNDLKASEAERLKTAADYVASLLPLEDIESGRVVTLLMRDWAVIPRAPYFYVQEPNGSEWVNYFASPQEAWQGIDKVVRLRDTAPCPFDPSTVVGPIGMFHCPSCGEMVVAGVPHPDYSKLDGLDVMTKGEDMQTVEANGWTQTIYDHGGSRIRQGDNLIADTYGEVETAHQMFAVRELRAALEALGAKPDGYCWCGLAGRLPGQSHTGECRDAQAALAKARGEQR